MIRYTEGDILSAKVEALVNTVNCVGIMGRGIALQFKQVFPANFKAYLAACKRGEVQPGHMFVFDMGPLSIPRHIINFPTKRHWRGKSRIEDIESGLKALVEEIVSRSIQSIAIPPLGSGLGGLNWADVRPRIERALAPLSQVEVLIFEPTKATADTRRNGSKAVPKMTAGRAALISLITSYLGALLDPTISLLEVHKLMYFLQAGGEPLRLHYVKGTYGPYAENLRHVLRAIEGQLIAGYADGGDTPSKPLSLVPGAVKDAEAFLNTCGTTKEHIERVARLVEGFETPYGLELLATVHWVVTKEGAKELKDIERLVYDWNARKRQFTPEQIRLATRRLQSEGWIS